jgi:hypothetical protein
MTRPKGRMYPFCGGSLMGAFLLRTTRASPEIPPHGRQVAGAQAAVAPTPVADRSHCSFASQTACL